MDHFALFPRTGIAAVTAVPSKVLELLPGDIRDRSVIFQNLGESTGTDVLLRVERALNPGRIQTEWYSVGRYGGSAAIDLSGVSTVYALAANVDEEHPGSTINWCFRDGLKGQLRSPFSPPGLRLTDGTVMLRGATVVLFDATRGMPPAPYRGLLSLYSNRATFSLWQENGTIAPTAPVWEQTATGNMLQIVHPTDCRIEAFQPAGLDGALNPSFVSAVWSEI